MKKLNILLIGLILTSFGLQAQKKKKDSDYFGFAFERPAQRMDVIPFKVHSNLIVCSVGLDNLDSLNFILDTGVSSIFITDPELVPQLNSNFVRTVQISGAGEKKSINANISVGHTFKIGNITGYRQNLVVLEEDILELSEYLGLPIHGIFGHDLFKNFVVTVDFASYEITLTKPEKFKLRKSHGTVYPIVVTQSKPYTDAFFITGYKETEQPVRLVIDTGAGHALLLSDNEEKVELPDKVIRANLGRGLNGEITGYLGRIKSVRMGEFELENVIASFPDSLSFSLKFPPADKDRQGSIGIELLRRFKTTFNYQDGYMALRPIKRKFKEPFEHDMSGMSIRASGKELNRIFVDEIIEDTPAWYAGLRKGDELLFFNNRSISSMTLSEILRELSQKEGRTVELFYRRNGTLDFTAFKLKRVI